MPLGFALFFNRSQRYPELARLAAMTCQPNYRPNKRCVRHNQSLSKEFAQIRERVGFAGAEGKDEPLKRKPKRMPPRWTGRSCQ
jgi:hypothetical protein